MRTLDRYVVRSFLGSALLWLLAMMSMRIVADLFFNMDEFAEKGRTFAQILAAIGSYYAYQSLGYFSELGGIVVVAAAAFTLARMNHTNELTAMLASGVSLYRVVWPIILCAMVLSGLVIVDREFIVPRFPNKMVLDRGETERLDTFHIPLAEDGNGAVWWSPKFDPNIRVMRKPLVVIRDDRARKVADVRGYQAVPGKMDDYVGWMFVADPAVPENPSTPAQQREADAGLAAIIPDLTWGERWENIPTSRRIATGLTRDDLLGRLPADGGETDLSLPDPAYGNMRITGKARLTGDGDIAIRNPRFAFAIGDRHVGTFLADRAVFTVEGDRAFWRLTGGKVFVPSDITADNLVLQRDRRWQDYLSVAELTRLLRLDRVSAPNTVRLLIQSRVTEPINNLVMLLIGLPFILSRERNIKASAALALLMTGMFYAFIYISRYMIPDPLWAAWMPVLLFGPIAAVMFDSVKT